MKEKLVCTTRSLPPDLWEAAAQTAVAVNPVNRPPVERLTRFLADASMHRAAIAALTTKYWHNANGVKLTVGFLDDAPADLRITATCGAVTTTTTIVVAGTALAAPLPRTGTGDTLPLTRIALALLAGGGLALAVARKRRRPAAAV